MTTENSEAKKPEGDKKPEKTVPLHELIAAKERSRKRETELTSKITELENAVSKLQTEARVNALSGEDDDDASAVKKMLVADAQENERLKAANEKSKADLEARETKVRAKELVAEYKQRGVEVSEEELLNADDMTEFALGKWSEHLAEGNSNSEGEGKKEEEGSGVFEQEGGVVVKKVEPKDMPKEDFDKWVATKKQEALSR